MKILANRNFSLIFFSFALVVIIVTLTACGGGGGGAAPAAADTSTTTTTSTGTGTGTGTTDSTAPVCTASVAAGTYNAAQSVSISCDETASVYYTTDGTVPVAAKPSGKEVSFSFVSMDENGKTSLVRGLQSRTVYSSAIAVSASLTLKFFGKDAAGNAQTVVSVAYVIDTTAPTVAITNNSGKTVFKNGDSSLFTIAFSEAPVDNATAPSISSLCTGTAMGISSVAVDPTSPIVFAYNFTAGTGDGVCTVSVSAADGAGNSVASVSGNSYTVDNTAPGAITLNAGNSVSETHQSFSVAVSGLEVSATLKTKLGTGSYLSGMNAGNGAGTSATHSFAANGTPEQLCGHQTDTAGNDGGDSCVGAVGIF